MRDTVQPEFRKCLEMAGFYVYKPPDLYFTKQGTVSSDGTANYPPPGRPDCFFVGHNRLGGLAEVKTARGQHRERYDFSQFDDAKRAWIAAKPQLMGSYWVYIQFGEHVHHKQYPKAAIMIPLQALLRLEDEYQSQEKPRKSLPYRDAIASPWALKWVKGKGFTFPVEHPFLKQYELVPEKTDKEMKNVPPRAQANHCPG